MPCGKANCAIASVCETLRPEQFQAQPFGYPLKAGVCGRHDEGIVLASRPRQRHVRFEHAAKRDGGARSRGGAIGTWALTLHTARLPNAGWQEAA